MAGKLQIKSHGDAGARYDLTKKKLLKQLEQLLPQILNLGNVLEDVLKVSQTKDGGDTGSSGRDVLSPLLSEERPEVLLSQDISPNTTTAASLAKTVPQQPSTQEKATGTEQSTGEVAKQEVIGTEGTGTPLEGIPSNFNTALSLAKQAGFDPSNICDDPKSPIKRTNDGSSKDLRVDCMRALLSKMLTRGSKEEVYAKVAPFLKAIADKTKDPAFFHACVAFIDIDFKVAPNGSQDFSKICDSLGLTPELAPKERASWEQKFGNLKEYV